MLRRSRPSCGSWLPIPYPSSGRRGPPPDGAALGLRPRSLLRQRDAWAGDPTFGNLLFGSGALVTSVQFGLGSSQRNSIAYVDYLQTNLLNAIDVINFGAAAPAAVPEPGSVVLLGAGMAGLALWRRASRRSN